MTLEAGKLRHRISIEARTQSRDSTTGAVTYTWAKITNGDEWADIHPLSTREVLAAASPQNKIMARIVIRHRSDVTGAMRVRHGAIIYSIEGDPLPDPESGLEYMSLNVSLGTNKGA